MVSTVTALARRPINSESFAGITDSVAVVQVDGALLKVTFIPDIDTATADQVVALMTSTDDADLAVRRHLLELRQGLDENRQSLAAEVAAVSDAVAGALDYILSH